jgi:hypothetical protein
LAAFRVAPHGRFDRGPVPITNDGSVSADSWTAKVRRAGFVLDHARELACVVQRGGVCTPPTVAAPPGTLVLLARFRSLVISRSARLLGGRFVDRGAPDAIGPSGCPGTVGGNPSVRVSATACSPFGKGPRFTGALHFGPVRAP